MEGSHDAIGTNNAKSKIPTRNKPQYYYQKSQNFTTGLLKYIARLKFGWRSIIRLALSHSTFNLFLRIETLYETRTEKAARNYPFKNHTKMFATSSDNKGSALARFRRTSSSQRYSKGCRTFSHRGGLKLPQRLDSLHDMCHKESFSGLSVICIL